MESRYHGGRAPDNCLDFSSPMNPLGPPEALVNAINDVIKDRIYTRYPDYEYKKLRECIADFYDLRAEMLIPLNGAAEALQLILPILRPKALVAIEPTFGDHKLQAEALGLPLISISYKRLSSSFALDIISYSSKIREFEDKILLYMSNPNNPTGCLANKKQIEELLECLPSNSYVILDEAFMDFTGNSESFLWNCPDNVIVLRSLTKILAIPGMRIGFIYTNNVEILDLINKFRQAWNVNAVIAESLSKLDKKALRDYIDHSIEIVNTERNFLVKELRKCDLKVYESQAPFLLIEHSVKHPEIMKKLISLGIYVRDASTFPYLTEHHSRVSVRLRSENARLVEAFKKLLKGS
ncbi:MAG: hypothetical protein DSO07_08890 [Thermoproteota archaeon]|jgi:histidinol-phosphate/aromatic aminotransferase/cobyric acid decarboxylase-like protein|uniref:Aminotransferase n=1 Tax=Candidatus Methanodesulfokora washburnensis TaxID=2478471 RepID=A0A3R9PF84_9CREN|nr:histidinol-phosphate transaminase [Candidatus Methanodesulfokores washburnensis]RSN72813.1 histidinol-phosphate aminotransferase family protein [Candidatus Methanodesulfokores washburnensis]RZN62156.1 MAG: histidinol-phosphate aminotransferase family protein [Candidatus Methanodesulfokores washburnensis]TDA40583.1 MAG: hypothetical protein DSO07_08890 [Candidatus Korarchaeota archaeon]